MWDNRCTMHYAVHDYGSQERVLNRVTIRGETHSVPLAMQRSLAHSGYHVGQIVMIARILAGDHWTTITIPRGASATFNQKVWGKAQYQAPK